MEDNNVERAFATINIKNIVARFENLSKNHSNTFTNKILSQKANNNGLTNRINYFENIIQKNAKNQSILCKKKSTDRLDNIMATKTCNHTNYVDTKSIDPVEYDRLTKINTKENSKQNNMRAKLMLELKQHKMYGKCDDNKDKYEDEEETYIEKFMKSNKKKEVVEIQRMQQNKKTSSIPKI